MCLGAVMETTCVCYLAVCMGSTAAELAAFTAIWKEAAKLQCLSLEPQPPSTVLQDYSASTDITGWWYAQSAV